MIEDDDGWRGDQRVERIPMVPRNPMNQANNVSVADLNREREAFQREIKFQYTLYHTYNQMKEHFLSPFNRATFGRDDQNLPTIRIVVDFIEKLRVRILELERINEDKLYND
ncbi:unnamed protein product [Caenorhabditis bovis]|uniref:Uncharacterized protein n=1 Tax=Caenorhabditis bovis TaxID=2654633 RepID=A0A8S1F836_9PELO|nr:unnamed protein product [Caenorhabditis bovis]